MTHKLLTDKDAIDAWLARYGVHRASVVPDSTYGFIVFVNGDVDLGGKGLKSIDVKFSKIRGHFVLSNNYLTSLEGCPDVVEGHFLCNNNLLTSLKGGPTHVDKDYTCSENKLITLEGSPSNIGGYFSCGLNCLTSLCGGPSFVSGGYNAANNLLDSLEFFPDFVSTFINLSFNPALEDAQNIRDFYALQQVHYMHRDVLSVKKALNETISIASEGNANPSIKNKI